MQLALLDAVYLTNCLRAADALSARPSYRLNGLIDSKASGSGQRRVCNSGRYQNFGTPSATGKTNCEPNTIIEIDNGILASCSYHSVCASTNNHGCPHRYAVQELTHTRIEARSPITPAFSENAVALPVIPRRSD